MWKRLCFAFVLLALLIAGCGKGETGGGGLILYTTPGDMSTLRVVDPTGKEKHRITLDGDASFLSRGLEAGNRAVYFTDKSAYLVDAGAGTSLRLDVPAELVGDPALAVNWLLSAVQTLPPKDWLVLGTARGDAAYLVNAETGEVSDLVAMHKEMQYAFWGGFSAGGDYLALAGVGLWLVPTADPGRARRLGGDEWAGGVALSGDGKQIAYTQRAGAGENEVVVEQMDGSGSKVVTTGGRLANLAFVPGQDQLVLVRFDSLALLSLRDGKERELLAYSDASNLSRPWFSPSGRKLLLGGEQEGTWHWHLVDLKGGAEQVLGDLDGYPYPICLNTSHRWLFFADSIMYGKGVRFASLDLESGEAHAVVGLDDEGMYAASGLFSPRDGLAVIQDVGPTYRSWLVQAETGQARALSAGSVVRDAISPDGRWAVAQMRDPATKSYSLAIVELEGDKTVPLAKGLMPIWVHP